MIRNVSVKNFRCLRDVDVRCTSLVALIGPNGSGKSAFLHALRFFFGDLEAEDTDCWGEDSDLEIEVAMTIDIGIEIDGVDLTPFLDEDGSIWVARRFSSVDGVRESRYVTRRKCNVEFADLREHATANPAKLAYNELRSVDKYVDLPPWSNFPALEGTLNMWEEAHPDELERVENDSIGFGSGKIDLAQIIEPVFVPAVRDAASDSDGARVSVLSTLIERIVSPRSLFADTADDLNKDVEAKYSEMIASAGDALDEAARTISARLARFAPGTSVKLDWEGTPPAVRTPVVRARLVEGGYAAEVGHQGHGTQRAFILALLHELAEGAVAADGPGSLMLLMIEEPELYLHPTRARMLARILQELTIGGDARTQVMYATHSPYFVGLDRIESLRVFRLDSTGENPTTAVTAVDLAETCDVLWEATGSPENRYTPETLLPRLRLLTETPTADGFFADGVVLVEGEEDRAFLVAAAQDANLDLDISNVAVIPVGGKTNLDRPLLLFRQLGIPTFTIFDCDTNVRVEQQDANAVVNRLLLVLLGDESVDEHLTQVRLDWASFVETMQHTIREEVGQELWDRSLREAADESGYVKVDQARKNPIVVSDAYRRVKLGGGSSATLDRIVDTIRIRFEL